MSTIYSTKVETDFKIQEAKLYAKNYADSLVRNGFEDAAMYGFSIENTAEENVIALQNAINGGNKTIIISKPGNYNFKEGVKLDDNTEIIAGDGVYFNMTENSWNLFINRGAETRTLNKNITLRNIRIKTNGFEHYPPSQHILFGLRGLINFFYIENLKLYNIECLDIGTVNWPIHICTWKYVEIHSPNLKGNKDGIHVGRGKYLRAYNIVSACYDDTFGFNCFDYPESNPEIGDIEDVVVENLIFNHNSDWGSYGGRIINFQCGRVGSGNIGDEVMRGDAFNINGKTYVVVTTENETPKTIISLPTINIINDVQLQDGIYWKLQKNGESGSASIIDAKINNLLINDHENAQGIIAKYFSGNDGNFSRTIHPNIPVENYPTIEVEFNGVKTKRGYFSINGKLGHKTSIKNFRGKVPNDLVFSSENTSKRSYLSFKDSDLTGIAGGITLGNNCDIIISDNIQNTTTSINTGNSGSRINGNSNLDINVNDLTPMKGDEVKVNGVKKIYNGSSWININ